MLFFVVVRFCFGLLWGEVLKGLSRPNLKLKLVKDGGGHFGEIYGKIPIAALVLPGPDL